MSAGPYTSEDIAHLLAALLLVKAENSVEVHRLCAAYDFAKALAMAVGAPWQPIVDKVTNGLTPMARDWFLAACNGQIIGGE